MVVVICKGLFNLAVDRKEKSWMDMGGGLGMGGNGMLQCTKPA